MPKGYLHATDVLPLELANEAYQWLGLSVKVTFAKSSQRYTSSEEMLEESIVDRIRDALDDADVTEGRTLLFGPGHAQFRLKGDPLQLATALVTKGYSLNVAADILGYSSQTLRRWGFHGVGENGRQLYRPNGTPEELDAFREIGMARCLELRPDEDRNPKSKHYLYVGAGLSWLTQAV